MEYLASYGACVRDFVMMETITVVLKNIFLQEIDKLLGVNMIDMFSKHFNFRVVS